MRQSMKDIKIVLFLCSWGPHAAYQTLQDNMAPIPGDVKMVRIPCTGRISKALLLKSFEMGADGVALVGCEPGTCRYGTGTDNAYEHVKDTRGILDLLGLGRNRLRLATFLPDESEKLLNFLSGFSKEIAEMGESPVIPDSADAPIQETDRELNHILSTHDVYACQDCGKCSSSCPLTLSGKLFSPRAMAGEVISGRFEDPSVKKDVWSCLTCGLCYDRCPSGVNFSEFVRDLRVFLQERSVEPQLAHGGFFQSLMRTMTSEKLQTSHWEWLPSDIEVNPESKILFFGGCAPYFDLFFRQHLETRTQDILEDSLRLLNFFDIHPSLIPDERCCGHDLLWSGDKKNFLKLAKLNAEVLNDLGVEEIVTACPECYRTLHHDYGDFGIQLNPRVTHIYELLEKEIDKGAVGFKKMENRITFQDPCRLSRFENRPDLPRKLMARLNPEGFQEMQDFGSSAVCCGNSAWVGCDAFSKALQVKRIRQAVQTKSDLLVTACPKCQIHLRCAMEDPFLGEELKMEMADLTSVLVRSIQWE